jgi:glycosyltransferase involved in cell wall biosynthesis
MADKGCNYIMTAVKLLNEQGYSDKFTVDFYGKVDAGYKTVFEEHVESLSNVNYYGLLNLKSKEGYDQLATYDAMLFPSFWRGEGFAGVFIDAFIAGLPVLASDWGHNADSIINGKTGLIFPVHHVEALRQVMEDCLTGKIDMNLMGKNARAEAPKYQADNVMTEAYLKSIGLIE